MDLVESRRFFHCRHCGSHHFPEGVEADGIRVVGHTHDAAKCPICTTAMARALAYDEPVELCQNCRGMLIPRHAFAELVTARRRWTTSPPVTPPPIDRATLRRRLACPRCEAAFETYAYGGPGNAVIDGCARCDLIWLDYRELDQIVAAPGRDRGRSTG
jgi:Zn-finger nucleic acid-binding protein